VIIDKLVKNPGSWLSRDEEARIVVSSRVRLARNLRGMPFPLQARRDESESVCRQVQLACEGVASLNSPVFIDMGQLAPVDKSVLKERHLISSELAEKGDGSGLILVEDEHSAIMINEEDHLRLQAICPGDDLWSVWKRVDQVDSELEQLLDYAFSPRLGYLTACPSNVGTGLRASVMMHLPGLQLAGLIDGVVRGLNKMGLAVRGLFGEGSQACGNMYQLSNQVTLGLSEREIIESLSGIVAEVAGHERHARERLLERQRGLIMDRVGRSFGILSHAWLLSSDELVELLSILRMGIEFGLISGATVPVVNEILLTTQPGHLQKIAGKVLGSVERDAMRGLILRDRLKNMQLRTD
jgi:protein arginine kinase